MPEEHRLVPSENVEQKKPARQSASPEHVPHSSVEAQEERPPIKNAARRARMRLELIRNEDFMMEDSGRTSRSERIGGL